MGNCPCFERFGTPERRVSYLKKFSAFRKSITSIFFRLLNFLRRELPLDTDCQSESGNSKKILFFLLVKYKHTHFCNEERESILDFFFLHSFELSSKPIGQRNWNWKEASAVQPTLTSIRISWRRGGWRDEIHNNVRLEPSEMQFICHCPRVARSKLDGAWTDRQTDNQWCFNSWRKW